MNRISSGPINIEPLPTGKSDVRRNNGLKKEEDRRNGLKELKGREGKGREGKGNDIEMGIDPEGEDSLYSPMVKTKEDRSELR